MAGDETERGRWAPPGGTPPPPAPALWHPAAPQPAPPAGAWTPGPPRLAPRQEGLATAALALALAAFVFPVVPAIVALVLAARAAGRIRASHGTVTGMGLVVAARVVATVALILVPTVLVAAGLLVSLLGGERGARGAAVGAPGPPATVGPPGAAPPTAAPPPDSTVRGRRVHILDVRAGDCVNLPSPQADQVRDVRVVPCGQPHDLEVFAVVRLPGARFPGPARVDRLADDLCVGSLEDYTGSTLDELRDDVDYGYFSPERDAWELGDRHVTCSLESSSGGQLTGSLRGRGGPSA
jgi:hypothetical protein